jgi:hypothetical protein
VAKPSDTRWRFSRQHCRSGYAEPRDPEMQGVRLPRLPNKLAWRAEPVSGLGSKDKMAAPMKKRKLSAGNPGSRNSLLEALPQEVLVRIAQCLPGHIHFRNLHTSSPELRRNLRGVWTHRLTAEFGLKLKVSCNPSCDPSAVFGAI